VTLEGRRAAPSSGWVVCALMLAVPLRAQAQDAAETPPEGEAASTAEVEPSPDEEARARFRAGLVLARDGDCTAALAEFETSYRLLPRPNTLFNMAQCEEDLHRYDRAISEYEQYLEIAPADAEDRDTVMATLESLRGRLGTIHITTNTPTEVWLGDRIVGVAPGDVLVPGGRHAIELRATGYLPERREVEVAARQRVDLTVELGTAETHIETTVVEETIVEETHVHEHVTVEVERPPLPPAVFWTGVGLTAAAGIVGLGAGINALVTHDQQAALDARLPRDTGAIADSALVADIGFIAGGALLVGTIVIGVLTDFGGEPTPRATPPEDEELLDDGATTPDEPETRAAVAPFFDGSTGGLVVGGTF
jgi:hypothetical protein